MNNDIKCIFNMIAKRKATCLCIKTYQNFNLFFLEYVVVLCKLKGREID